MPLCPIAECCTLYCCVTLRRCMLYAALRVVCCKLDIHFHVACGTPYARMSYGRSTSWRSRPSDDEMDRLSGSRSSACDAACMQHSKCGIQHATWKSSGSSFSLRCNMQHTMRLNHNPRTRTAVCAHIGGIGAVLIAAGKPSPKKCYTQHVVYCLLHVVCRTLSVARCLSHVVCRTLDGLPLQSSAARAPSRAAGSGRASRGCTSQMCCAAPPKGHPSQQLTHRTEWSREHCREHSYSSGLRGPFREHCWCTQRMHAGIGSALGRFSIV